MIKNKEGSPECVTLTIDQMGSLRIRIEGCNLEYTDKTFILRSLNFTVWLQQKVEAGKITLHKLRRLFLGGYTESRKKKKNLEKNTTDVTGERSEGDESNKNNKKNELNLAPLEDTPEKSENFETAEIVEKVGKSEDAKKPKGHGRLGADAYPEARTEIISSFLKIGDNCPELLCGGRLYEIEPGIVIRIIGQRPADIIRYTLEKLRCNLCGIVVKASMPKGLENKYDAYFKANLAVQRYFVGVPFKRQESYYQMINFPLPDATQFELVESVADSAYPVMKVLEQLAANGERIYSDDTRVKILSVMKDNQANPDKKRTGMFTSGIYADSQGKMICLYYSGVQHAGENLSAILKKREDTLAPIIHMCDPLSSNLTPEFKTILCHCLVHGRRQFADIDAFFPEECGFVIDQLSLIYKHDEDAKEEKMSGKERLRHHQEYSKPIMDFLWGWMEAQITEHKVEPNGGLGKAIKYMQKHWVELTKFLWVENAPLDNNIVERSLKIPIRCRKNSLFYRTEHGAAIGNILTSLIYTCYLAKKNPVDYLTALQDYKSCVFKNPENWLPWNYEGTVDYLSLKAA